MDIKADEISKIIREQIGSFAVDVDVAEVGSIISIGDGIARVHGIENVMAGSDSKDIKKMRVEEIIGGEATATGRLGVRQLQSSVAEGLASLGIDAEGVEALSLEQLAQIENVMASSDADETKRARIGQIMAQ